MKKYLFSAAGALGLLLSIGSAPAQQSANAQALFGITFFGNQLITIDPATGQGILVAEIGQNVSGFGLAAYQGALYTFNPNTNTLDQLSVITGHVLQRKEIGVTGLQGEGDLAIRSDTGIGFLAAAFDSDGAPSNPLYRFDVKLGAATRIGHTAVTLDALAFDANQTLYALGEGDGMLYIVDQLTGALTPVGSLGVSDNSPIAGMTLAPDGTLYASIEDRLYRIDTTTGAATVVDADVLDFDFSSVSGLAYANGASALGNLSTRAHVGMADDVLIDGFILRGAGSKDILIRGLGPSLQVNGEAVAGALADPMLTLYDQNGIVITSNDDWKTNANRDAIVGTGLAPQNDKESAILATLPGGSYTAILRGANSGTGVGLNEIYDLNGDTTPNQVNLSARAFVGADPNVLIGGLIVQGSSAKKTIIRAIGPSLAARAVPNPLLDPTLQLFDVNGNVVAANDNWRTSTRAAEIEASGLAPADDRESVIDIDLATGEYTAVVQGVDGSAGVGLVEVYDLVNP